MSKFEFLNMAETPGFIFNLLEDELRKIKTELLQKVSDEYDIEFNELLEKMGLNLKIVPNEDVKVQIIKKRPSKNIVEEEDRCQARVWNRGQGGQCKRKKTNIEHNLCSQHFKNFTELGKLRHGLITEPPVNDKPKRSKVLYK